MITSSTEKNIKPTAQAVIGQADFILNQTKEEFDDFLHNKLPNILNL